MNSPVDEPQLTLAGVMRRKSLLSFAAGLLVTGLLIFALVRFVGGRDSLGPTLQRAQWAWLLPGCLLLVFNLYLSAERWRIIVHAMGFDLSLRESMNVVMVTWPLAMLTPSRASDLLRAFLVRDKVPVWEGGGSVLAEKLIYLQSLCLFTMVGSALRGLWVWFFFSSSLLMGLWSLLLAVLWGTRRAKRWDRLQPISDKLECALHSLKSLARDPFRLALVCLLSLLAWASTVGIILSALAVVQISVPLVTLIALWPLAVLVGQLPLTLGGMGTRDLAFLALLTSAAASPVDKSGVLAATFLYALIVAWFPSLLGTPFLLRELFRARMKPSRSSG